MFFVNKIKSYPFWGYLKKHKSWYAKGLVALFAVDLINVILPLLIKMGMDGLAVKNLDRAYLAGGLYLGFMILQSWGRYLWRIYLIGISHKISRDLRREVYGHLQTVPLGYYQKVRTGDLMSRLTNDIESVRMAVGPGILVTVDAILMFVLIVPVMFSLSTPLSLLTFAFYPFVPFLTAWLGDKIDTLFESLQVRMSKMGAFAQESFAGIRLIKSLVLENRVGQRFFKLSYDYQQEGMRLAGYQAAFSPALGLITNLGTFLILLWGGKSVIEGAITVGTFIAFQRFVVQLSWPMEAIGWAVTMNREGAAAQRRLDEIKAVHSVSSVRSGAPATLPQPQPRLWIRSLDFVHELADPKSRDISLSDLQINPGSKIGLVGPVGSGKSTLFNLLLRLCEPSPGSVYFEGKDIVEIPLKDLRRRMSGVEQQIFLFSETIADNLRMGNPRPISEAELWQALEIACVAGEVRALTKGLDTILGERGVNLSGGQKQRIALSRALLSQPELLVLDDCFSAVDVDVENRIIHNFFAGFGDMTVLFASHRLSVMPLMDEIWVIDQGRIVARGTHAELMKKEALYHELWEKSARSQMVEELGGALQVDNVT